MPHLIRLEDRHPVNLIAKRLCYRAFLTIFLAESAMGICLTLMLHLSLLNSQYRL
ncbi:unnamed protein product [Meloidogyne enterolobii]|uniref:Uncharacterized protein n=1 Tax=Meloidogyne enterolobii TaxID=390850 RepID=A0ACB0ZH62_MELEN